MVRLVAALIFSASFQIIATPIRASANEAAAAASDKDGFLCDMGFDCVDHVTNASTVLAESIGLIQGSSPKSLPVTKSSLEKCLSLSKLTRSACFAPVTGIADAALKVQAGVSALRGVAGQSAVCTKIGQLAGEAEKAMMVYNAACGGAAGLCFAQCKFAASAATKTAVELETRPGPTGSVSHQQLNTAATQATGIAAACATYTKNLAAVGAGLLLNKVQQDKAFKCQNETLVGSSPSNGVNCADPTNAANNIACICQLNPRAQGCPGAAFGTEASTATSTALDQSNNGPMKINPDLSANSGYVGTPSGGGGGGGSGTPGGGSSGGGAGGGSVGGAADKSGKLSKTSGIDPNVLAGEYGGGGGGRRSVASGGSEPESYNPYKKFLPGGASDPSKDLQVDPYSAQISGSGGMDNFQKVKLQSANQRNTLLQP